MKETIMLDWMGKMVGLPDAFLSNKQGSIGGGAIQVSNTHNSIYLGKLFMKSNFEFESNFLFMHCRPAPASASSTACWPQERRGYRSSGRR